MGIGERRGARARRLPETVALSLFAGAAAAGAVAYGCSIYDSSLLVAASADASSSDGGPGDAGMDASADAQSTADGNASDAWCGIQPPSPPSNDDGMQDITFTAALRTLDFGASSDAGLNPFLGYDLDGVCTCPGVGSCQPYMGGMNVCDEPMGRDNSTGKLLNGLASQGGTTFNQSSINTNLSNGEYGLLMRVTKYNGSPNDTNVSVAIFVSDGTPIADGGSIGPMPVWDGNDVWTLDSDGVVTGGGDAGTALPRFFDPNAYVTDNTLVAAIDFPLTLGGGPSAGLVTINLTGGFVTATIAAQNGSYGLTNGELVGRWATGDLLGAIAVLSLGGSPLCQMPTTYAYVKSLVCASADLTAAPNGDAAAPCSALSLVAGFTASPAVEGPVYVKTPGASPCDDAAPPGDCF